MPFLTHRGLRLRYECSGEGPAVLLLHGIGASADDWDLQLPDVQPGHTVLRLDLRGFGQSETAGWFSIADMAADCAAVLDGLRLKPAHVIGHSLGGAVALALALARPDCVRSLTLANTFARWRPAGSSTSGLRAVRRVALLLRRDLAGLNAFIAEGMFPGPALTALRESALARLNANVRADTLQVLWRTLAAIGRFDVRGSLGRVIAPTLIAIAGRDSTVAPACSVELAEGIPLARRLVLADAGHGLPMERPEVFNATWRAFSAAH